MVTSGVKMSVLEAPKYRVIQEFLHHVSALEPKQAVQLSILCFLLHFSWFVFRWRGTDCSYWFISFISVIQSHMNQHVLHFLHELWQFFSLCLDLELFHVAREKELSFTRFWMLWNPEGLQLWFNNIQFDAPGLLGFIQKTVGHLKVFTCRQCHRSASILSWPAWEISATISPVEGFACTIVMEREPACHLHSCGRRKGCLF